MEVLMATPLKSQISYHPSQQSSVYSVELSMELFLHETERQIWQQIREEAAKALANQFIAKYGQQIIESVSYMDVSQKVVEEVVKRMIDTLKEK
jgi:hypothetical protein